MITIGGQPPLAEYIALAQRHGFGGIEEVVRLGHETSLGDVKALFEQAGRRRKWNLPLR